MASACNCGCPHCERCRFQAVLDEVEYHTEQRRLEQTACATPPCPECARLRERVAELERRIEFLKESVRVGDGMIADRDETIRELESGD